MTRATNNDARGQAGIEEGQSTADPAIVAEHDATDKRDPATLTDAELTAEMRGYLKGKPHQRWHWVRYKGQHITAPKFTAEGGAQADGTDPRADTAEPRIVLEALVQANRDLAVRRSAAAKKAAATRERRRHLYGKKLAIRIAGGEVMGPSLQCKVCDKPVTDPASIARGIGSDCWQFILGLMEVQP